ncbi:MAG TPA: hypothetical protein VIO38_16675 [Rariglobus sp.]
MTSAPPWETASLLIPPRTFPCEESPADGLRSLLFEGPAFHGKPTRVFAYWGPGRN